MKICNRCVSDREVPIKFWKSYGSGLKIQTGSALGEVCSVLGVLQGHCRACHKGWMETDWLWSYIALSTPATGLSLTVVWRHWTQHTPMWWSGWTY